MMKVEEISEGKRVYWDKTIEEFQISHPFNSYGWGKVREIDKWVPRYMVLSEKDIVKGMVMILYKKIPWTGFFNNVCTQRACL